MVKKSMIHSRDSWKMGANAEQQFKAIAIANGYPVVEAGAEYDRRHIDFFVNKKAVEVKSAKRISRQTDVQYDKIWVELQGVSGHPGWLFGDAQIIAFQMEKGFVLIRKRDLQKLVEEKVDKTSFVDRPEQALYKQYRRRGRLDTLTLVEASEIKRLGEELN